MLRPGLAVTTLAVASLVLVLAAGPPAHGQDFPVPHVTVSGEASRTAAPDLAQIRAGVTNQAKTAREAAEANARTMTAVIAALTESGIDSKDIQTARLSIQPLFTRPQDGRADPPRITGYQVSNSLTVKVRSLGRIGEIFDKLTGAGANHIWGVDFQVSESSKLLDAVRAAAVADAKRKAEIYAQAAGAQLGRVMAVSESAIAFPRGTAMRAAPQAATPVAPGEETLSVTLSVTFELVR